MRRFKYWPSPEAGEYVREDHADQNVLMSPATFFFMNIVWNSFPEPDVQISARLKKYINGHLLVCVCVRTTK